MKQRPFAYAAAVSAFALFLGIMPATAQSAGVRPGEAGLNYEIYAGGLHVLTFDLAPRGKNYSTAAQLNEFYRRGLEQFRHLPGVESVAFTNKLPLDGQFNLP